MSSVLGENLNDHCPVLVHALGVCLTTSWSVLSRFGRGRGGAADRIVLRVSTRVHRPALHGVSWIRQHTLAVAIFDTRIQRRLSPRNADLCVRLSLSLSCSLTPLFRPYSVCYPLNDVPYKAALSIYSFCTHRNFPPSPFFMLSL